MTAVRTLLVALAVSGTCAAVAQSFEWGSKDGLAPDYCLAPPRIRVEQPRPVVDDLRELGAVEDYRTVRVPGKKGRPAFRRVPTEEYAARLEQLELERDVAEMELRLRQRSP